MRLEENEAKYPLMYTPGDIPNMRKALAEYTQLIQTGDAFENDYCVAHFQHTCDKISIDYFKEHPDLIRYLEQASYYYTQNSDPEDIQTSMTGEALFFLCALMHPGLEADIMNACKAIVQYSRTHNNSSKMWLTCEHPFGIEPLHITATKYPKYGYLLASFLIPYWDDEHMPEPLFALGQWARGLGIMEDTINAYCYCDNARARENMIGYDTWDGGVKDNEKIESDFDLLTHFREKPLSYKYFTDQLAKRYKDMPFIQTHEDDERYYIENPIKPLVAEMLYVHHPYNTWDDDFDLDAYLTHTFIDTQADEAIEHIKYVVEDKLGRTIVPSKETVQKERKRREWAKKIINRRVTRSETVKWRELVTKVFPNGEDLWLYVQTGDNQNVINSVESVDLVKKARDHKCALTEELKDATYFSNINERFYRVFRGYVSERIQKDYYIDNRVANEEILRLFDILHRAMNCPSLHSDTLKLLCDDYEIADKEDLYIRYSTDWKVEIESLLLEIDDDYCDEENERRLFERLYTLISDNREAAVEVLSDWFNLENSLADEENDDFLTVKTTISSQGYALVGMYILYRDDLQNLNDEVTEQAQNYIEFYVPDFVMKCLTKDAKWPKKSEVKWAQENAFNNAYQQGRQKEILDAYELWMPMEVYLLTGRFKDSSHDKSFELASNYFKDYMKVEDDAIGENQPQYSWLCRSRDENKALFKIALMGANRTSLACNALLQRVLKLTLHIAPLRVIKYLEGVLPQLSNPDNLDDLMGAMDLLKELGLPESAYWIYQLNYLNEMIDKDDVDFYNLECEPDYVQHYVRLMKLYFNDIETSDIEFEPIEVMIREGGELLPRRSLVRLTLDASKVLGSNFNYQGMLDSMAQDKIIRALTENLETLPRYLENLLELSDIAYSKERLSLYDLSAEKAIETLETFGAKSLSGSEMHTVKEQLKENFIWQSVFINKQDKGLAPIYNQPVLDLIYTTLKKGAVSELNGCDIFIIENCPEEYIQSIDALKDIDYKEFWMTCFKQFLSYEIPFTSIQDLLKCAVHDYDFLGRSHYYDVDLSDLIMEINPDVRNQILHIIGGVDPKLLDLVDKDILKNYVEFTFTSKVSNFTK